MYNDAVILVDSYTRTRSQCADEYDDSVRLANALSSSGLSITLTSLCSTMAFFVGSSVDMPGVSAFCIYAAWSFLANYILQFLLFVPLMVIDDRRIDQNRNACCPCWYRHPQHVAIDAKSPKSLNDTANVEKTRSISLDSYHSPNSRMHSLQFSFSDSGDSWLSAVLLPVMTRRMSRLLIIILFLCTLSGSIYVLPVITKSSDPESYVPDDSVIIDFVDTQDAVWSGAKIIEQDIIIKNQDFSDIAVRDNVHRLISDLESQDNALGPVTNWLDEFAFFLKESRQEMDTMNASQFYSELQSFSNGTRWETEIIYDDPRNPTAIKMTRFKLSANGANRFEGVWPECISWNDVFDGYLPSNDDGYILQMDCLLGYLNDKMMALTASNMIFAGIGVLCALMVFVDLRMALFMTVIVAVIDVHIMAWIWALGIDLDPTVFIICVIAVGLTVDYMIHITHSIADAQVEGDSSAMSSDEIYAVKWKIAMQTMGVSVCKGAVTTFIGVAALAFAQSAAYRIFFKMFSGIIVIAMAHGMILTPALMGECRFIYHHIERREENTATTDGDEDREHSNESVQRVCINPDAVEPNAGEGITENETDEIHCDE